MEGDPDVGRSVYNFINQSLKIRSEMLSIKKEREIALRIKPTVTRSGRLSKRPTTLDL